MRAERLGHTKEQLGEHQLGIEAEDEEEEEWLGEFIKGYREGKAIYPVGFGYTGGRIKRVSLSIRE